MQRIVQQFHDQPLLRICIGKAAHHIDFTADGPFSIIDEKGEKVATDLGSSLSWRLKINDYEPSQFLYSLMLFESSVKSEVLNHLSKLESRGVEGRIQTIGGHIKKSEMTISDNSRYQVWVGEFNSRNDAHQFAWNTYGRDDIPIVSEKIRESRGIIEIFDAEFETKLKLKNAFVLYPDSDKTEIEISRNGQDNGNVASWQTGQTIRLPLDIKLGNSGELCIIQTLNLESYVTGVLIEIAENNEPLESIKSKAIVVRGLALSQLGLRHHDQPYDYCDHSHCQTFKNNGTPAKTIEKAIRSTKGTILFQGSNIGETHYSPICGGFTEQVFYQNGYAKSSSESAIFDGEKSAKPRLKLQTEKSIKNWIQQKPPVNCCVDNWASRGTQSLFRWERIVTRVDVEKSIFTHTGLSVGTVYDIIPVRRGKSGRVIEIEVLGSRHNIRIKGYYRICHSLSPKPLPSTCFYIESHMNEMGIPDQFLFIGGGEGHGIGLCLAGTETLAENDNDYVEILKHYFPKKELRRIY